MNQEVQYRDRFEAPSGSRINRNNLIIGALIAIVILAFGYISLSMGSEGASKNQDNSFQPRLHTESNRFKMPEFKKPEPLVTTKQEPAIEAIIEPPIKEETPVLPLSLPKIEAVEPLQTRQPKEAPPIDPDLARRLGGSISGGSDLDLSTNITAPQRISPKMTNSNDGENELNTASLSNNNNRAGGSKVSHEKLFTRQARHPSPSTPRKDRSPIDLSSRVTHASLATRLENRQFLVKKGTFINCVLTTNIQSDQAGFIKCSVTEDIYSADGTLVLIDRGSEILGEYKPESLNIGKARLHAVWDEVTTPSGVRVSLRSPSVDRLGATGLTGAIDNHWKQRLGVPILLSLFRHQLDYRLQGNRRQDGINYSASGDIASDRLERHYQQYEKIRPTLSKRAGSSIGIILARDVSFESVYKVMQR